MHLWTVSNSWYIALPTKSAGVNSQLHYSQKIFWLLVAVPNTTLVALLAEKEDEKVWFLTILVYHYKAITGADCGRLYKLLWAPLDPSICSLATIHRVNTNILIAATILVQAFPTCGLRYCEPICVDTVIMPRWAKPQRHTVVIVCLVHLYFQVMFLHNTRDLSSETCSTSITCNPLEKILNKFSKQGFVLQL